MRVYPTAPSGGSYWILGMTLVIAAMVAGSWALGLKWLALVFLPFALFSLLLALWLPRMAYELGDLAVVARRGPFRFTVPYARSDPPATICVTSHPRSGR